MLPPEVDATLKQVGINTSEFDRIRLARGVVGKASYVAAAAVIALAVVAYSLRDPVLLTVDACLTVLLFVVYFVGVLWFANRHPGVSLLEGAELIQWRQMEIGAKDITITPALQANAASPTLLGTSEPRRE